MIENTDPDKVFFELDVYWASKGGVNPSAYIQKYAGRFPLLHIKDVDIIGASETIDFESIFKAAYKQGLEEYYVEIEANSLSAHALRPQKRRIPQRIEVRQVET